MENIGIFIEAHMPDLIFNLAIVCVVLFILLLTVFVRLSLMSARLKKLLKGSTGASLEEVIRKSQKDIESLRLEQSRFNQQLESVIQSNEYNIAKVSLKKYNAFDQQGGELSFVLVLLNRQDSGILLHNIHNTDFAYSYTKKVNRGRTEVVLTPEEKEALKTAINQ